MVSDLFIGAAAVASVKAYMSKCAQDTLDEIALLLEARETDRAEKTGSAPLLPPQREPHEPRAAVSHLADHRSSS